jgi:hypothetical protein
MYKGKEKVTEQKHVKHVEKLDIYPKTVGIPSQSELQIHPLARAQAQKAHPPVREPRVQRDLQREKANRPKERVKARWDPSLESSTRLRTKRKLSSGLKSLKQKARRLGMKKHGKTKMANGMNKLVNKVPYVLPMLTQHGKHPNRGHSLSLKKRWKENRRSS